MARIPRPWQLAIEVVVQEQLRFLRDNFRWLAGGFLLLMLSSFGQTFFIGLAGNELRVRFDLSGGAFGLIYLAAPLASGAVLPWRSEERRVGREWCWRCRCGWCPHY